MTLDEIKLGDFGGKLMVCDAVMYQDDKHVFFCPDPTPEAENCNSQKKVDVVSRDLFSGGLG